MKEREQIVTFNMLKVGKISQKAAATQLGFSTRWIRKKFKRFLRYGDIGLVHQSRGRKSPKAWNNEEKEFVMSLFEESFEGFGPTFAAEKLQEIYNINVCREVLRKAMIEYGHWKAKVSKPKHRMRRDRKEFFGEMIQLDGSPHNWFGENSKKHTLLVFIDDATSMVPFMKLAPSESTETLMVALKSYIEQYGRPLSLYVDFGSAFSVNINNHERDKVTQFNRACKELGIKIIYAHSPEAKGRVERSNKVHQDRLIKELRLAEITNPEDANKFIQEVYLPKHNKKFAIPAKKAENIHRSIENYNLNKIFCIKEKRIIQNDFIVQYKNRILQLTSNQKAVIKTKESVTILEYFDGNLGIEIRGFGLNFIELKNRPKQAPKQKQIIESYYKPKLDHPWRNNYKGILCNQGRKF